MLIENLSRRNFLKGLGITGTGMVLGIQFTSAASSGHINFSPDVFISMGEDGTVSIICHRSEMGQGIRSSSPLLIADEMEADFSRVVVEQALADPKYGSQNTDGSRSIRLFYHRYKQAGATARTMLQHAAAKIWQVEADKVKIHHHKALLKGQDQSLDFADLVSVAATLAVPDKDSLVLKKDSEYRYVGKDNISLIDGKDIATGQAIYGFDVQLDELRIAVIERPPVLFGKVKSYDDTDCLKVRGVEKVVELPALKPPAAFNMLGGVAIIASNTWAALEGRRRLKIEWEHGPNAKYDTQAYEQEFVKALQKPPHVTRQKGDWETSKKKAAKIIEAEYYVGGLAHAPMEPPAATARINDDGVDVWACTQTPQRAKSLTMGILDIPEEDSARVRVNVTLLGGGFGRKSKPDYVVEAAYLAKKTGWPIKVLWTREDEIKHGYYHSPAYHKLAGAFDKNNKVDGFYFAMVNHPIGATFNPDVLTNSQKAGSEELGHSDLPFDIPNMLFALGESRTFNRIGWVRSVTNINNAFAACCFVDEMAVSIGADPKDFLLQILGRDRKVDLSQEGFQYSNYGSPLAEYPIDTVRFKNTVALVADKAGWGKKLPPGHGMGIAAHRSFCSYVATVVEVSVQDDKVKLENVYSAIDAGKIINPDRVHSQLEGAAIFSASNAFYGEITAKDGSVSQSNFHDYQLTRFHQSPKISTYIVNSSEEPAGVGEPGVPPFAPALCNAIYAASGKRYRRLPLKQFGIV